jgi:bis(5'-adenosyl)-triphosphatase
MSSFALASAIRTFVQQVHNGRNLLLKPAASKGIDFARLRSRLAAHGLNALRLSSLAELKAAADAAACSPYKAIAIVEEEEDKAADGLPIPLLRCGLVSTPDSTAGRDSPALHSGTLEGSVPKEASNLLELPGATMIEVLQAILGYPGALEDDTSLGFGPHRIPPTQVFYESGHCFALVNVKPVLPGHVLVVSRRRVASFLQLYPDEASDLMQTAQKVATCVGQAHHGAKNFTLSLQDGPAAGQTVPHIHFHIVPRLPMDLTTNDAIYDLLETSEKEMGKMEAFAKAAMPKTAIAVDPLASNPGGVDGNGSPQASAFPRILPPELRKVRTPEEMAEEAESYRRVFREKGWA